MEKSSKVLLFDLGNVLLPIDLDLTYKAFANYSTKYSFEEIKKITFELSLWEPYESGQQTDQEFRTFLKKELYLKCSDDEFDKAFNALLLSFPAEIYSVLASYKNLFSGLYLLSNTSKIHSNQYFNFANDQQSIFTIFDSLFLSYELGLVKPDTEIYKKVALEIGCKFQDIIFFDDNYFNIESALNLGINAHLIEPSKSIHQIKTTLEKYVNA